MSYILDAIKKSEAERGHGSIPGLQTVHSSSLNYKTERKQLWPYIIIALLLINTTGLIYYFLNEEQSIRPVSNITVPTTTTATTTPPTTTRTIASIQQPEALTVTPAIQTKKVTAPMQTTDIEDRTPVFAAQSMSPYAGTSHREIVSIDDLPDYLKLRIPTMDFTGHVYSSNPQQRSIIINGSFMEEGDAINHELTLSEITAKGAVFNIEDTFFAISILSGWKLNQ